MKKELWQDKQKVLTEDLERSQSTKEESIRDRLMDLMDYGVLNETQINSEFYAFEITPGDNNAPGNPTITIGTGIANSPIGERISILDSSILFDPDKPNTESDDGLGGFKLTPQSTGSKDIPLSQNLTNYIWLGYLQTIDQSVYTIKKDSTEKLYTKADDGYEIITNTTGTNPNSSRFIKIGEVTTTTEVIESGINVDERILSKIQNQRVKIEIDSSKRPTEYSDLDIKFLDDHINAIGAGLISKTNPHGLAPADIGIVDVSGQAHQSKLHSTGVFTPSPTGTGSALYMDVIVESETNNDLTIIRALNSNELGIVNGISISNSDIPNDLIFVFIDEADVPISAGFYLFSLNNSTKIVERLGPFTSETDPDFLDAIALIDKMPLWSIEWRAVPVIGNPNNYDLILTTKKDWRIFGNMGVGNIQQQIIGGLSSGSAVGNRITYLYNARLIGSVSSESFIVNGDTLIFSVNGGGDQTISFSGIDPISIFTVVYQINTQGSDVLAIRTSDNYVKLLATDSISIGNGTANTALGFTLGQNDSNLLKEIQVTGEIPGSSEIVYDGSDRISIVTSKFGNKTLSQTFIYLTADPDSSIKKIQEEILNP